jgi:hypothetical protein
MYFIMPHFFLQTRRYTLLISGSSNRFFLNEIAGFPPYKAVE